MIKALVILFIILPVFSASRFVCFCCFLIIRSAMPLQRVPISVRSPNEAEVAEAEWMCLLFTELASGKLLCGWCNILTAQVQPWLAHGLTCLVHAWLVTCIVLCSVTFCDYSLFHLVCGVLQALFLFPNLSFLYLPFHHIVMYKLNHDAELSWSVVYSMPFSQAFKHFDNCCLYFVLDNHDIISMKLYDIGIDRQVNSKSDILTLFILLLLLTDCCEQQLGCRRK